MKLCFVFAFLACGAAWAADPIPMNVKTGQWEATVTSQISGLQSGRQMPQIPPEQLAKLPPEQRARIEAAMKMAGGAPTTTVSKSCITKEDLLKLNPNNNDRNQNCKTTLVSSSGTKQELTVACESNGGKQNGTITVEALSSDSMKFSVQMTATNNGRPAMNMTINGTSKWLGAACSDAK